MQDTPRDELHDELLENRFDRYLDRFIRLPKGLRAVTGCGIMIAAFLLGAIAWGLLLEFIF